MILSAAWVMPICAPPIRSGYVAINHGRITEVGPISSLPPSAQREDLGSVVLMPGLVNPHTHLELTCYRGQIPPGDFWTWIPTLVPLRAAPGQVERESQGVYDGAWESLRFGVTCVGDISRRNLNWPVLKDIPIRKVCFVELLTLADDPPRNIEELREGALQVQEDELLRVGISPHAPYSVPADQLRGAITLASELDRPWCTHWAETTQECAFLRGECESPHPFLDALLRQCNFVSPQTPPFQLLASCCADLPPGALAHYNYPDPGDAERLAAAGHVVMFCPRAHRYFRHTSHPYRDMMRAGVTVAIGTDSAASNTDLSILAELRYLLGHTPDPPTPAELLRMATLDGACALRLDKQIGSLEPGKLADLAAFPIDDAASVDPARYVIETAPPVHGVWVRGRRVV